MSSFLRKIYPRRGLGQGKTNGADISEMRYVELTRAPCNQILEVMAVNGDVNWEMRFEVDCSKISLGRNIAAKIEVEVLAPPAM